MQMNRAHRSENTHTRRPLVELINLIKQSGDFVTFNIGHIIKLCMESVIAHHSNNAEESVVIVTTSS